MTLVQKLQMARRLRAASAGRRPLSSKIGGRPRHSSRTTKGRATGNRSTGGEDSLRESSTLQAPGLASSDETASELRETVALLSEQLATARAALERHTGAEAQGELQPPVSATGGGAGSQGEPVQPAATGTPATGRFEVRPATSTTRGAAAAGRRTRIAAMALGRPAPGWHGDMRRFR